VTQFQLITRGQKKRSETVGTGQKIFGLIVYGSLAAAIFAFLLWNRILFMNSEERVCWRCHQLGFLTDSEPGEVRYLRCPDCIGEEWNREDQSKYLNPESVMGQLDVQ
jgi:hypothetical protein